MSYSYLLINLGAISVPFIFSFHPKLRFDKTWYAFFPAMAITAIIFLAWDILFTKIGVWGFNTEYLTGIYIFNLPLEEVLFFFCIPYACVFTWHCFQMLIQDSFFRNLDTWLTPLLIVGLLLSVLIFFPRLYTTVTFTTLASFLVLAQYVMKVEWLGRYYFTYLVLLIPFFIVNGLLTGLGLDEPIVWYNNEENMGVRLLTIPLEDVFYGMLVILMNISLYEYFKYRFR